MYTVYSHTKLKKVLLSTCHNLLLNTKLSVKHACGIIVPWG